MWATVGGTGQFAMPRLAFAAREQVVHGAYQLGVCGQQCAHCIVWAGERWKSNSVRNDEITVLPGWQWQVWGRTLG